MTKKSFAIRAVGLAFSGSGLSIKVASKHPRFNFAYEAFLWYSNC